MKTLVFAIAAVMVSGSMAFAAINDQSVSQQPVNEPDTTQVGTAGGARLHGTDTGNSRSASR